MKETNSPRGTPSNARNPNGSIWAGEGARPRLPEWLKIRLPGHRAYPEVMGTIRAQALHTVCQSARCPNLSECWGRGTATFMILGNVCTRRCGFCAVPSGRPDTGYDPREADRLAEAVVRLGIRHAVVTSVDRDDLPDLGSELFALVIEAIRRRSPQTTVEVLTPDFQGTHPAIDCVVDAQPEVFAHNLETVPRLYRTVRPGSFYARSLEVLARARERDPLILTKTSVMIGLGETDDEVAEVMRDAVANGVDIMTLGQYLQPSRQYLPVARFLHPDGFRALAERGHELGLKRVEAGPMVRSSYKSESQLGLLRRRRPGAAAPPRLTVLSRRPATS